MGIGQTGNRALGIGGSFSFWELATISNGFEVKTSSPSIRPTQAGHVVACIPLEESDSLQTPPFRDGVHDKTLLLTGLYLILRKWEILRSVNKDVGGRTAADSA